MPPKGDAAPLSEKDQNFLVECIKSSKEKLVPDYGAVGKATSMSKGGAANKFRLIMQRFEAGGAAFSEDGATTIKSAGMKPKPAAAAAAAKKGNAASGGEDENEEDGDEEVEPPKKKARTNKPKAPAKTKAGSKKGVARKKTQAKSEKKVVEEDDGEDDEDQEEDADVKGEDSA